MPKERKIQNGQMITLEEFEAWALDGKIDGVGFDARSIFDAIQTRLWHCPVCDEDEENEEEESIRIEHSLDATIDVGNPICELGHDMELVDER